MKKILSFAVLAVFLAIGITACVKTDFDEPPTTLEPVDIVPNMSIAELKNLHITPGGYDSIPRDLIIAGEVVMDDRSGNYYKTLVIQDSTGGIEVKFNDSDLATRFNYVVGRKLFIRVGGLLLTDYNGITQLIGSVVSQSGTLEDFGLTEAQVRTRIVKGPIESPSLAPRVVGINELNTSMLSTLIQLRDVQFIAADTGRTYADPVTNNSLNRSLEDCEGRLLILRSSGYADFAAVRTATGNGTITGVLGIYDGTFQLYIRDVSDVQFNNARCGFLLNEDFSSISDNVDVSLPGWKNVAVQGNRLWRGDVFNSDKYVQATAFNSGLANMETWLISPPVDLSQPRVLTFRSSWAFFTHNGLTVWISTDFNGQNAATATWLPLNGNIAKQSDGQYVWVNSGNVTLPQHNGVGYIGFKYSGNTTANTTTWRIDDVKVK